MTSLAQIHREALRVQAQHPIVDSAQVVGAGDDESLVPLTSEAIPAGGRRCRTPAALAALAALTASAVLCAGVLARGQRADREIGRRGAQPRVLPQVTDGNCKNIDDDQDYVAAKNLEPISNVRNAKACRTECEGIKECNAWTWGKKRNSIGLTDVCFPKVVGPSGEVKKKDNTDVSSGFPCRDDDGDGESASDLASSSGVDSDRKSRPKKHPALRQSSATEPAEPAQSSTRPGGTTSTKTGTTTTTTTRSTRERNEGAPSEGAAGFAGSMTRTAAGYADSGDDQEEDEDEEEEESTTTGLPTTTTVTTIPTTVTTTPTTKTATAAATTTTGEPLVYAARKPGRGSFYCFALMLPGTDEESLLLWQVNEGVSLFACEEAAVYSNVSRELVPGLSTLKVDSNLVCDKGGEFGTALNTEIFFAVWDAVIANGRYKKHDWVVKVDPDSVFFPHRMHDVLDLLIDDGRSEPGVYINNCQYGMHGPLEVLSRAAVDTWDKGRQECVDHFEELCKGPCLWGEDMFLDQCLQKVLNSTRIDDFNQLLEDHCSPPDGWQECTSGSAVAFHPYKNVTAYKKCFHSALEAGGDDADTPLQSVSLMRN
jgi:hypothetical protein